MTTTQEISQGSALVTGAGTGIGAAISEKLAAQGRDLVLVARDGARLEVVAERLRSTHGVEVQVVPLDLSRPDTPTGLAKQLDDAGIEIDVLVNNAGVALAGPFTEADPARTRTLIDLNAAAVAETTALFLPAMLARGRGAIVNIASTAAYSPTPYNAAYGASKAFVLSFTQALWYETRGSGVRVVAVSPGATRTPMNPGRVPGMRRPEQVADTVVAALRGRGPAVVDGRFNVLQALVFSRLLASRLALRITGNFFRKAAETATAATGSSPR